MYSDSHFLSRVHPVHGRIPYYSHTILVTEEMREFCKTQEPGREMSRTRASMEYAYLGALGECVWFCYRYGQFEWEERLKRVKKGEVDDLDEIFSVEVKASKTLNLDRSHLMVREDYARKRSADGYALVLFSKKESQYSETAGHVVGYATQDEVLAANLFERNVSRTGKSQGFRNYEIPVGQLHRLPEPHDV